MLLYNEKVVPYNHFSLSFFFVFVPPFKFEMQRCEKKVLIINRKKRKMNKIFLPMFKFVDVGVKVIKTSSFAFFKCLFLHLRNWIIVIEKMKVKVTTARNKALIIDKSKVLKCSKKISCYYDDLRFVLYVNEL